MGRLYKVRKFCPPQILRSLYFSIFNSHLSYGLSVWGFADQIYVGKIKALQRRAICNIGNDDKSSDDIFIRFSITLVLVFVQHVHTRIRTCILYMYIIVCLCMYHVTIIYGEINT